MPSLAPLPKFRFFTAGGAGTPVRPLVGGKVYFYEAGTTTPKDTYTDASGLVTNANPVVLNARGEADIWLGLGAYKMVVTDADGAQQGGAVDNIEGADSVLSALRSDLANTSGATKGPAMVGNNPALAYAAGTVGAALRERISVNMCGGGASKTATQNAAAINLALSVLATMGGGGVIYFPDGQTYSVNSTISCNNLSRIAFDLCGSTWNYTGAAGTYALDFTQAGQMRVYGGKLTGSGANHCVKTRGSAAAQATAFPTIPAETEWARQLWFTDLTVSGFETAFDLQNFTREVWVDRCYVTGNTTAIKAAGKVANLYGSNSVLYSAVASSQAVLVRGDAADAAYRYAEGLFFTDCIGDTKGTTVDVRDCYGFGWGGAFNQLKTTSGGIAFDVTKGVCPITREIGLTCGLMQGKLRIGNGLAAPFLFDFKAALLGFSDTADTAITISDYTKGVLVSGATFNNPTGATPRMFTVGANCTQIKLDGLSADAGTYVNTPTVDATSAAALEAEFSGSFVPGIAFGGSSTGVTYATQSGRFYWRGGQVTGYFEITLTSKGSQVGSATITGLPYPCKLVNGVATVGKFSGMATALTPILDITKNTQVINIKTAASGSETVYTDTNFSNASVINGSFSYPIS